ncbi:MAG: SHOCT domain-containing protein [Chloroflexi bacterium]|nr:SHOCT domain-containing protein [Chloroflexota bacterium]
MNWSWGFWGIFGMLLMILFWAAVIAGIVLLVRWLIQPGRGVGTGEPSAIEILKKRYARGEIGKEEFEEKKRDLT